MNSFETLRPRLTAALAKYSAPADTGCILWAGTTVRYGYGAIYTRASGERRTVTAHRAAYMLANGPIPPGMHVCHKCDVPACVNPDHLFLGTAGDNLRDMVAKGRHGGKKKARCPKGHPYAGDNLRVARGQQLCRECNRESCRQFRQRKRANG